MRRSLEIPILLWIPAAILVHLGAADGGDVVAKNFVDRSALDRLGAVVRERVRASEQTLTIEGTLDAPEMEQTPPDDPIKVEQKKKEEEKKKEELAKKEEQKKAEEKKKPPVDLKIVQEEKKHEPPPQLLQDKRIAVKQHAAPNQDDNPNANYLSEEANHVKEETAATQTSLDQDDPNPTPGGNRAGADIKMGDSDRTKIAQNEDKAGEKDHAPGDKGTEFTLEKTEVPKPSLLAAAMPAQNAPNAGGDQKMSPAPTPTPSPQPTPAPIAPSDPVSEANGGGWAFNPIRPGAVGGLSPTPAQGKNENARDRTPNGPLPILGLGGAAGPGQVNLNLTQTNVVAAVGEDQLRRERVADGERRKSEHRGSWVASSFERWRTAIENYVSSVKPGNQTALNAARSPFATYLHTIHNRIHPIFADSFLGSLESLPKTHPLNDPKLITRLEIVLSKEGQVVKMGVVKTSGMTAFDVAALDSVQRASPFGPAPSAIVSPDNRVYLHWEFHRDEVFACSTMNARPFILNVPAGGGNAPSGPEGPPRTPSSPSRERELPSSPLDTRQGAVDRPRPAAVASRG